MTWRTCRAVVWTILLLASPPMARGGAITLPDNDVLIRAMTDELKRSKRDLVLEDLARPYFLQYSADDRMTYSISAAYGGLQESSERRARVVGCRVRVGSYALDNTNIGRGGARGPLPLDDDYTAIRHTLWRLTDDDYKRAVETLTRKQAYLREKTIEDRPDDFVPAEPTQVWETSAVLSFDRKGWEEAVQRLSARFKEHPKILDARVGLFAGAVNEFIVNSEGTRLRSSDTGVLIKIDAQIQADDGMMLEDDLSFMGQTVDQLPPMEKMLSDIDALCTKLVALSQAPVLEQYTGPVLFEAHAAGRLFQTLLAEGLCARPVPLGSGGGVQEESLEKKLGLRILPRSFQVHDDPGPTVFEGTILAGAYRFDDEGVPAARVELVQNGVLKSLLAGRAPTKKIKQTNGHARGAEYGDPRAVIGCLYLSDNEGVSAAELKEELIQAAREEGLEFGLRIEAMRQSESGRLGSPVYVYKVYVSDGHEELVRGLEFLPVQTRALKRILVAGSERAAYNSASPISLSIIAPPLLFEELELRKLEEEFDKPPILKSPATR